MNDHQRDMFQALGDLQITTDILLGSLKASDGDKAHEAITVMLLQGMNYFGEESVSMHQFFPVWDAIKTHIDRSNFERALSQTITWQSQLREIVEFGEAVTEVGVSHDGDARNEEAEGGVRQVLDRIANQLGILQKPIATSSDLYTQVHNEGLIVWGTFNPMGPTISTLSLITHDDGDQVLLRGPRKLDHFGCEVCCVSAVCTVRFCANSSGVL